MQEMLPSCQSQTLGLKLIFSIEISQKNSAFIIIKKLAGGDGDYRLGFGNCGDNIMLIKS